MAEQKTKPTAVSVEGFLNKVADAQQREDSFHLLKLMKDITGVEPKMWGPTMVGFGDYHYVYASGHEGDCFLTGFSPRKDSLSLYVTCDSAKFAPLMKKLGKYKAGKACLYVKRLSDIDLDVLRELIEINLKAMNAKWKPASKKTPKKKGAK
jgi:hypothetical protein